MAFQVNYHHFQAEGRLINWWTNGVRLGFDSDTLKERLGELNDLGTLHLRWLVNAEVGIPTEPFNVWARHVELRDFKPIPTDNSPTLVGNHLRFDLTGEFCIVEVTVSGGPGEVIGYRSNVTKEDIVAVVQKTGTGTRTLTLRAPVMTCCTVTLGMQVVSVRGILVKTLVQADGWELIERVGFPVEGDWSGINHHNDEQGIINFLMNPKSAAKARLERAVPPFGWAPMLEPGHPAPNWIMPDFETLIINANDSVLSMLKPILAAFPPNAQAQQTIKVSLPLQGANTQPEPTQISPLFNLLIGVSSDPFLSLVLGFGTGYRPNDEFWEHHDSDFTQYDFMVTAHWENGLGGNGSPLDYAAVVPQPYEAIPPPRPANPSFVNLGYIRPIARDLDWRFSAQMGWDRPPKIPIILPRTMALARRSLNPLEAAIAILEDRVGGGKLPLVIYDAADTPDPSINPHRVSATDADIPLPSAIDTRVLKMASAHQDLYGLWSIWTTIDGSIPQPAVQTVPIISASLDAMLPPISGATCAATLTIDFLWDWSIRTPMMVEFSGRLYPTQHHGQAPPDTSIASGLQQALSGAFASTQILFNGNVAQAAPTNTNPMTIIPVDPTGETQVNNFGSEQGDESRRYRVTISGLQLNFASTSHIGLALWARGQEQIAPQRIGPWSTNPKVITVSDPRPPVVPVTVPDIVTLTSVPDANGEGHAKLTWGTVPGALGYFLYESTESKLLQADSNSPSEPILGDTLSQRFTTIKTAFQNIADTRRHFSRKNVTLLQSNSVDITIPRGSQVIHVYVVMAVNGGGIESEWLKPADTDKLWGFAAPQIQIPAAPMLTVNSIEKNGQQVAHITVETRDGPRVNRIDLHRVRVDDAARTLDTMGPSIQTIDVNTPNWNTQHTNDALGTHIVSTSGDDVPTGSWKRVWYRAVAWSSPDPLRGTLAGRSPASNAFWIVVPPEHPPDLSAVTVTPLAGGNGADVLLQWTSKAPIKKTPLGPHKLSLLARPADSLDKIDELIRYHQSLDEVTINEPPATESGVWHVPNTSPTEYRAIVRRTSPQQVVLCSVRVTDPIGRTSERLVTIGSADVLIEPQLYDFAHVLSAQGLHVNVSWKSNAPLDTQGNGSYIMRVVAHQAPGCAVPFIGNINPPPPITLEMPIEDIPLHQSSPALPNNEKVIVRRMPGEGPEHSYYAFATVKLTSVEVQLTSPTGSKAEHTQLIT